MNDPAIRRLLKATELSQYLNDGDSRVVEEMDLPVAKARIDIAVINGALHGYEIKSAVDTLKRLPGQIEAYTKVFDFMTVVTEAKYHERILKTVPDWVGVITCQTTSSESQIIHIRRPQLNTQQVGFFIAKLLWHDELIACLESSDIKFRKKDRNWLLCTALSESMPVDQVARLVREKLKTRTSWKPETIKASYAVG